MIATVPAPATTSPAERQATVERARANSPFLAMGLDGFADIAARFVEQGSDAAINAALAEQGRDVGATLRRRRTALALALALGDLAGELPLELVIAHLSEFADGAIDAALAQAIDERVEGAGTDGFAVLALGKLGSRELNYSSDVDLILIFDPATLARRAREDAADSAVRIARRMSELLQARTGDGYVLRVDLRLRPAAEVTPSAISIGAAISYYESAALAWERAAFIRARAAAGDQALGRRFLHEIRPFIWRRALDFGAVEELRDISARIRDHYDDRQDFGPGFDLKRGRGGIREAEFFAQVQQLIHGGRDPTLRAGATLDALAALAAAGHVGADEAAAIGDAYRALRTAEHRVQMIDDRQEHRLPIDFAALDRLARLDGRADGAALLGWLEPHVAVVGARFDTMVVDRGERLPEGRRLTTALRRMGFADVASAAQRVNEWRSGRARSLRSQAARDAFEAMLPAMLGAIGGGPDPERSLNRFADLVERLSSGVNLYRLIGARPALAELVALMLAHAPPLAEQLSFDPTMLDSLIDETVFNAPLDSDALIAEISVRIAGDPLDLALGKVRHWVGERRFALGAQLVAAICDPMVVARGYSDLAEAAVVTLAAAVTAEFEHGYGRIEGGELVVLGLGRLGGRSLTHASDLDLIHLFDSLPGAMSDGAKSIGATDYYNRLATRIGAALAMPTGAGPLYEVDTRLRPQGRKGLLAVSLDSFAAYQRGEAWTWEHMALCRARPLTGSAAARARVAALVRDVLLLPRDADRLRADAAAMRRDMAQHKPPAGRFDVKLGEGGLVDLEFTVHTLQLGHHVGLDPSLSAALAGLAAAGLVDDLAEPDLVLLTRVLVVLRLLANRGSMEPAAKSRALLASLCGVADWTALVAAVGDAQGRNRDRWAAVQDGKEARS